MKNNGLCITIYQFPVLVMGNFVGNSKVKIAFDG